MHCALDLCCMNNDLLCYLHLAKHGTLLRGCGVSFKFVNHGESTRRASGCSPGAHSEEYCTCVLSSTPATELRTGAKSKCTEMILELNHCVEVSNQP